MAEDVQEKIFLASILMSATTTNGSWIGCSNQIVEIVHNIFFYSAFFCNPKFSSFLCVDFLRFSFLVRNCVLRLI